MDVFTPEKRRDVMRKIRSKGTKPELEIKGILDEIGVGYVYQAKLELGNKKRTVDFLIPSKNLVIEYRSCFWHGCPLHYKGVKGGIMGKEWWEKKIERNKKRDKELEKLLKKHGYDLLVVWEHDKKEMRRMIEEVICN